MVDIVPAQFSFDRISDFWVFMPLLAIFLLDARCSIPEARLGNKLESREILNNPACTCPDDLDGEQI